MSAQRTSEKTIPGESLSRKFDELVKETQNAQNEIDLLEIDSKSKVNEEIFRVAFSNFLNFFYFQH